MKLQNRALLSDGWWIEENMAWFIDEGGHALWQYDFISNKCSFLSWLPVHGAMKERYCSGCIKCGNDMICIPDKGTDICLYSLENQSWKRIEVYNPDNKRIWGLQFKKIGNYLIIFSRGLKKLIRFETRRKIIEEYVSLSEDVEESLGLGVFWGQFFYVVSTTFSRVYEYDITANKKTQYDLPDLEDELNVISYKEEKFIICGKKKKVYIWDKRNNQIDIIHNFPMGFGEYNFNLTEGELVNCCIQDYKERIFSNIRPAGRYIWCIPFQTNQILYFDMKTLELKKFELPEEEETKDSLERNLLGHKYLIEYIKDNRYIGLYSLKNEQIVEIDAEKLTYRRLPFLMNFVGLELSAGNEALKEGRQLDEWIYLSKLKHRQLEIKKNKCGNQIYKTIIEEI